jgi:hypothetical protein
MKKSLWMALLLLVAMLSACSSGPDYKIQVTKGLYFQKNTAMPFEVKITENNKAAKGLKVSAELSMTSMDHGTYKVKLIEGKSGFYTGKIKLPMAGKYEMAFSLKKGSEKAENVFDYTVKKPQGVAMINGKWITQKEVDFDTFLNYLALAAKKETAQKTYRGKQLEEELSYIKSQESSAADQNQILTQIIRLHSMAILAVEKGHRAGDAEINTAISKARSQYDQYTTAKEMIKEYGEEKFWKQEKEQYRMKILANMVQQDVLTQVKKENPNAGDQELQYLTQEKYEDLLVSQVNSLKIEIL